MTCQHDRWDLETVWDDMRDPDGHRRGLALRLICQDCGVIAGWPHVEWTLGENQATAWPWGVFAQHDRQWVQVSARLDHGADCAGEDMARYDVALGLYSEDPSDHRRELRLGLVCQGCGAAATWPQVHQPDARPDQPWSALVTTDGQLSLIFAPGLASES